MKRLHLIFLLGFLFEVALPPKVFAQQIEWAKTYSFGPRSSYADKIVQLEDSTYAAISRIGKFGYRNNSAAIVYGLALIRLDKFGDTLYIKKMFGSSSGTQNSLAKTGDFNLLIGVTLIEDTLLDAKMRIYKCDYQGNIQWMYHYIGDEWLYASISKVIPNKEGGCFAIGSAKSIFPDKFRDMFLTKLNAQGQLEWTLRYTSTSSTSGQNIEEMPDGNYLLSGGADSTIWSVVVDSNGVQLSDYTFASMPGGLGLFGAEIKQGQSAQSFYGVGTSLNPRHNVVNRFDSARNKVWQKVNHYLGGPLHIGNDGSFVRNEGIVSGPSYLSKYKADSSTEWRVTVGGTNTIINNIAYDGLGSAVLAGYKKDPNSNREDVYFIKVSNVGLPVDPLSSKEKIEPQNSKGPELLAYPNPAQQYFYLKGIKAKTRIGLYNLQGHLLKEYRIGPNDAIPVWQLPAGLYVWKAEDGKKVWTGKILKVDN